MFCHYYKNDFEKFFNYLNNKNGLNDCCIDCLIPNMFKDKNIENFKLFLHDNETEINIKSINFNNHKIKLEIKVKEEWLKNKNLKEAYLLYAIPEKGFLSNYEIITFKDGTIISDKDLDLNQFNVSGESTIVFIMSHDKSNYFSNIENMIIKLFF